MNITKKMLFAAWLASQLCFLSVFAMDSGERVNNSSDNVSKSPKCDCFKCENPVPLSPDRRRQMDEVLQASKEAANAIGQEEIVKIILQEHEDFDKDGLWPTYTSVGYDSIGESRWSQLKAYLASWVGK